MDGQIVNRKSTTDNYVMFYHAVPSVMGFQQNISFVQISKKHAVAGSNWDSATPSHSICLVFAKLGNFH